MCKFIRISKCELSLYPAGHLINYNQTNIQAKFNSIVFVVILYLGYLRKLTSLNTKSWEYIPYFTRRVESFTCECSYSRHHSEFISHQNFTIIVIYF